MSLTAAAILLMAEKGLTAHEIAEIAAANEPQRSSAAIRQKRYRDNKRNVTRDVTPSPNEINNLTPTREKNTGAKAPCKKFVWACPDGVHPDHWRDFLRNRRTRSLTNSETAYQGQLRALAEHTDDEWPPGRLVQYAAEKGWGSINDPRKSRYGQPASNVTSLRGNRPDPALDLLRAARAAEDREDHWRAGASLPSLGSG